MSVLSYVELKGISNDLAEIKSIKGDCPEFYDYILKLHEEAISSLEPTKTYTISSAEQYKFAIENLSHEATSFFKFHSKYFPIEMVLRSTDHRFYLDYLPIHIGRNELSLAYSNNSLEVFKSMAKKLGFHDHEIECAQDWFQDIDLLKAGSLIKFADKCIELPYARFKFGLNWSNGSHSNPMFLTSLMDVYLKETDFSETQLIKRITHNLFVNICKEDKTYFLLHDHLKREGDDDIIFDRNGEFAVEYNPHDDTFILKCALKHYFFKTILPLLFLDNQFKRYVRCTLLDEGDYEIFAYNRINLAFLYFIFGCEAISGKVKALSRTITSYDMKALFASGNSDQANAGHDAMTVAKSSLLG